MNNEASKWACRKHLDSQIWPSGEKIWAGDKYYEAISTWMTLKAMETNETSEEKSMEWDAKKDKDWTLTVMRPAEEEGSRGAARKAERGPGDQKGSKWRKHGREKEWSSCQMLHRGQYNWSWTVLLRFWRTEVIGDFGECTLPEEWWGQRVGWRVNGNWRSESKRKQV